MKNFWLLALGLLGGLLGAGLVLLVVSPPRGQPVQLAAPPTPPALVVYIVGAVAQPGVYNLPAGSRVQDAIQAAGGLSAQANSQGINLAAPLRDGIQLTVPEVGTQVVQTDGQPDTPVSDENSKLPSRSQSLTLPTPTIRFPININTASLEELDQLPGVGLVIAQRIIDYREANGPFPTKEAIMEVKGIGETIFERIKDLITVD